MLLQPGYSRSMPVGIPLDTTAVFILPWHDKITSSPRVHALDGESSLELAEHGSVGEVCIAGACVAAGYLGQSPMAGRYWPALLHNLASLDTVSPCFILCAYPCRLPSGKKRLQRILSLIALCSLHGLLGSQCMSVRY